MTLSVVIPTHNRRATIGAAIDSVLAQKDCGHDVEVVVIDDRSTDDTADYLRTRYAADPVRIIPNEGPRGPAGARNAGIQAAEGDFVAFLDSDDAFLPAHLRQTMEAFSGHAELGVVFGRARYEKDGQPVDYMRPNFERKLGYAGRDYQDETLIVFDDRFFDHLLRFGCWFNLSTVVLRREAASLLMNDRLRISEDYEFWVRLARRYRFGCLLDEQIRYALHDDNISFETEADAAGNAPRLLLALDVIAGYDGLSRGQLALIRQQQADILFDWGYRVAGAGHWLHAVLLHWKSARYGNRVKNVAALAKLPFRMVRGQ